MKVGLAMYHQPEKLKTAMVLEGMRHGDEARATIPNVRVEAAEGVFGARGQMYFCNIGGLRVHGPAERTGDGNPLPDEVELVGKFHAPRPGFYNLENVRLFSNGSIQVIATEETRFVPVEEVAEEG